MTSSNKFPRSTAPRQVFLMLVWAALVVCPPQRSFGFGGAQPTRYLGIVQTIDYHNKTIAFQPDPAGKSLSLGWNWETSFLLDNKRVKAETLKAGVKVRVKYRSPLLGREYATKVEWESAPAHPAN